MSLGIDHRSRTQIARSATNDVKDVHILLSGKLTIFFGRIKPMNCQHKRWTLFMKQTQLRLPKIVNELNSNPVGEICRKVQLRLLLNRKAISSNKNIVERGICMDIKRPIKVKRSLFYFAKPRPRLYYVQLRNFSE